MSVNDDLQDLAIQHAHHIQRFTTHEIDKIQVLLRQGIKEVQLSLLSEDITVWTEARYRKMLDGMTRILKGTNSRIYNTLSKDLKELSKVEGSFSLAMLQKTITPLISWDFTLPSASQLWAAATQNPLIFEGGTTMDLRPYLRRISSRNLEAASMTLRQGQALGKPTAQISRELMKPGSLMNSTRNFVDIVARTATNHVASMARKEVGKANSDIVKGHEWLSTLDRRTSDTCIVRDGQVWYYDEKANETEVNLLPGEVYPPAHFRCRSTTTYITKSWRELGIDFEEVPPSTRASMDGQVGAKMNYREWIAKQPAKVQMDVLGKTRYEMLQAGEIRVDEFFVGDGRRITLQQLGEKGFDITAGKD